MSSTFSPLEAALAKLGLGAGGKSQAESIFYYALLQQYGGVRESTDHDALAWVDKRGCSVNPELFGKLTLDQRVGVLAHEARHLYQNTGLRCRDRIPMLYNIASDLVINEILKDSGFTLPDGLVTRDSLCGKPWPKDIEKHLKKFVVHDTTEEQIYKWLYDGAEKVEMQMDVFDENGDGEDAEVSEAQAKLKVAAAAHAAQSTAPGSMPAWLEREIEKFLIEETPWPEAIRDWMTSFSQSDLSWNKLDGIILSNYRLPMPDLWSESIRELVLVVDTSGSMTEELLSQVASHVSAGLAICAPEKVHVVYCDADINRVETSHNATSVELKMCGGGGTDFRPPFKWVAENAPQADGIIYFTDGYGEFPDDPGIRTLWCVMKGCNTKVPFGRMVEISV